MKHNIKGHADTYTPFTNLNGAKKSASLVVNKRRNNVKSKNTLTAVIRINSKHASTLIVFYYARN